MSRFSGTKHVLPQAVPTRHNADYSRLTPLPGPWSENVWVVVPHAGDVLRNSTATCSAARCEDTAHSDLGDAALCYAHWWQWRRAGQPALLEWLPTAKTPQKRSYDRLPRAISFDALPPLVATEMRYVVGRKITDGDWTPNRPLEAVLHRLIAAVADTGVASLLDRRPEDWTLLLLQDTTPSKQQDVRSYLRTFFATLLRALVADPWAEDVWLWRNGMDHVLGAKPNQNGQNIHWTKIDQDWLRIGVKALAKQRLTTGKVAWGTVINWCRALTPLSEYLTTEGLGQPEDLDRETFLEYLLSIRQDGASKNALMGVNTAASVLGDLRHEGLVPALGSEVYLRHGENAVERCRQPKPYPDDVLERIDLLVLEDRLVDPTVRLMLRFNRWGGLRISELVVLPIDCLRHNGKNGYWIEYLQPKTKNWRRFPIPTDIAELLLEQQRDVHATYGNDAALMFPSASRSNVRAQRAQPWSMNGLRNHQRDAFQRHGITHSSITGERITGGEIHRYRHSIGTALLNNNWTQREVQEFLGHASGAMTAHYAEILDETLTAKSRAFHEQQEADRPAPSAPQEHPGVERLRQRFVAVLPNGYCQNPHPCEFRDRNPCLDCSFFDDGGEDFADVHANHRKLLTLFIADNADSPAKVEINSRTKQALDRRVPPQTDEGVA